MGGKKEPRPGGNRGEAKRNDDLKSTSASAGVNREVLQSYAIGAFEHCRIKAVANRQMRRNLGRAVTWVNWEPPPEEHFERIAAKKAARKAARRRAW